MRTKFHQHRDDIWDGFYSHCKCGASSGDQRDRRGNRCLSFEEWAGSVKPVQIEEASIEFARVYVQEISAEISRSMARSHVRRVLADDSHHESCVCFGSDPEPRHLEAVLLVWGQLLRVAERVHQVLSEREIDHDQSCVCFTPAKLSRISGFLSG